MRVVIHNDKIKWLINIVLFEEGKNLLNKTFLNYFLCAFVCNSLVILFLSADAIK